MKHYDYQTKFKALYHKAVEQYRSGNENKSTYFNEEEKAFIAANGWRVQDFYDYAEDVLNGGEPTYEVAQSIEQARREYFLHIQNGQASQNRIASANLPPKSESVRGISWLPRILPKARAKLLGELPDETMYCCGGDRNFLSTHDIHPAEFLRLVWAHIDDDEAIIDFVESRSPAAKAR